MKTKSFTLIELLVVIVIIGILAGVIIVSTSSSISKANFAKAQAFSNTVQQELLLNLVSEWTFDEGDARDTWGNNDGTVSGATYQNKALGNCVYGGCYSFNGTTDYIDCGNNKSLSMGTGDQTISMWVKFDDIFNSGTQILINNRTNTSPSPGIRLFKGSLSSKIYFQINDSENTDSIENYIAYIKDINWHYLTVVINRDAGATAYVDSIPSGLVSNITARQGDIQNSSSTRIGTTFGAYFLKGLVDDVRIYNATLSSSQIKKEYIAGLNSLLAKGNISEEDYLKRIGNKN